MLAALTLALVLSPMQANPPIAVPTKRQLEWQKLEYHAFVHFGPNTFTDREWGEGKEDPNLFNPTALDCRQWVRTFKEAGMKQVTITAKHHDGFCLWPTKYSTHTVAQSKWRGGKGDVLGELRKACNEYGVKMGVYLSPWDRNHPKYGTPEYNQVFADMLKEVLTKYGPIYEVWFDGANGEGPNGKRQVYDWPLFISTVRKYAPDAVIFSDNGPDIRWVGNEDGIAGETCWSTIDRSSPKSAIGAADQKYLNTGDPNGKDWVPAECDVSIRPGWFYHASQDNQVKSPEKLLELWEKSVGRNGSLLLNVPPDRRGLIHENDVTALMGFKKLRESLFENKVALSRHGSPPSAGALSASMQAETPKSPAAINSASNRPAPIGFHQLSWDQPRSVDTVVLSEDISIGHGIRSFQLVADSGTNERLVAAGDSIGAKRIIRIQPITTKSLTLRVPEQNGKWRLAEFSVYASPLAAQITKAKGLQKDKDKRMAWFREARFGMFIHWGLYAVPAGVWKGQNYAGASEWLMNTAKIPVADYKPLQPQFNPVKYDAKRWVQIAKDAGMKYIVITSKHHDGFALFDSKLTDWDIMNTPFKRDALKELAAACKAAGIKLCFYHSIMDWTHPDYGLRRPWDLRPNIPTNMDRYTAFMKGQLKELLTNYGDIGILWFDGEWEPQAWTHERGVDLYNYVRSLQPNIIVNNRVDVHRSGMAGMSASDEAVGDYGTPEQEIPANGMPGLDWESCMTMNGSWGFHQNDHNWKSAPQLARNLIDCASKGGNYLLNVGPTGLGEIPEASVQRLAEVGGWMKLHGGTIYGTQAGPFPKQPNWGRATRKGNKLFLFLFNPSERDMNMPGLEFSPLPLGRGQGVGYRAYRFLDKKPIEIKKTATGWLAINPEPKVFVKEPMPEVFVIEFSGDVKATVPPLQANADGSIQLNAIDAVVKGTSAAYEGSEDKRCIGFWTNAADVVEWSFMTEASGTFDVSAEIACEAESAGSEFTVNVGATTLKGKVPNTGGWSKFVRVDLGKAQIVTKGKVTVSVKATTKPGYAVMNLRSVTILKG